MVTNNRHVYSVGYLINFLDDTKAIIRKKLKHIEDAGDITYTIRDGDELTSLAHHFYGDSTLWYLIADINEIMNPEELVVGTNIIIPNRDKYEV